MSGLVNFSSTEPVFPFANEILKDKAIFILTDEPEGSKQQGYEYGRIDKEFLKKHIEKFDSHFYICGPMQFIVDIKKALDDLGASPETVVIEL